MFRKIAHQSRIGILVLLATVCLTSTLRKVHAADPEVHIYIDADFTHVRQSSICIERGIRTALHEAGDQLAGRSVRIIRKDHRGNSLRSKANLLDYLADSQALVIFSGLHSPPLVSNRDYINEKAILTLVPWAAAGPITRYPSAENWIFRLSVDDTKAGEALVHYAVEVAGYERVVLLLENTSWGQSSQKSITRSLEKRGLIPLETIWFNWGVRHETMKILLRGLHQLNGEAVILVANAPEGVTVMKALLESDASEMPPLISHWGITGGDFPDRLGPTVLERLPLVFLQTRFSFASSPQTPYSASAFSRLRGLYPSVQRVEDVKAPPGFIHAHDLTLLLAAAVEQIGLSGNMIEDRKRIRAALENLEKPVQGLIKVYRKPFAQFSSDHVDAHEALGITDIVMAQYRPDGQIVLLDP